MKFVRTKYVVVAMSVLAKFKKKGGRFVEKNYRKHQVKVVGDRQILPWIMQALSDRAAHHNKAREGERSAVPPPLSILPRAKLQVVAAPAVLPPSRPSASPEASSPASEERRSSSSRRSSSNNDANTNDRRPVDRDQHRRRCRAAAAWSNASTASLSQPDNDEPEESDTDYDPKDKNFKKKKARTKKATPPTAMPMPMLHHPDGRPVNSLNDNDVLMGKGPQFSLYPGNFFFREVVRQHRYGKDDDDRHHHRIVCPEFPCCFDGWVLLRMRCAIPHILRDGRPGVLLSFSREMYNSTTE
jgi:hypothetical protein